MAVRVDEDLRTELKNAAARLGVTTSALWRACLVKYLDEISEDEAVALSSPELRPAYKRRKAAERAREVLAGGIRA